MKNWPDLMGFVSNLIENDSLEWFLGDFVSFFEEIIKLLI